MFLIRFCTYCGKPEEQGCFKQNQRNVTLAKDEVKLIRQVGSVRKKTTRWDCFSMRNILQSHYFLQCLFIIAARKFLSIGFGI